MSVINRRLGWVVLFVFGTCLVAPAWGSEILLPGDEFKKLDTFEAVAIEDADKLFNNKDYRGAYAAYKAYSLEFAQGRALPYALLRMGRCLHLADKRNTAIKAYQDVVDYFPDDVRYAAAAMYYIGECHKKNGNPEKALATWAKMVKDKDYVGQANSGTALIELAQAMQKRGDHAEAAEYQWRTAVAFRKSNKNAAIAANRSVVYHFAVRSPNHKKLVEFCKEAGGFGWHQKINKPEESATYWQHVFNEVLRAKLEKDKKADVCRYWDAQLGDRFIENDALRVAWFNLRLAHDGDGQAWGKRMDEQFKRTPITMKRVKQWLSYYNAFPKAKVQFFQTHGMPLVKALETKEKLSLVHHLRHNPHRMAEEAGKVLAAVRTDGMDDPTLGTYANLVADFQGEDAFLRAVAKMKDKAFAAKTRFDHYYARSHPRSKDSAQHRVKALAEVGLLKKSPDHAQAVALPHAQILHWNAEYPEAIKLYKGVLNKDNAGHVTNRIADCLIALKQHPKAIKELETLYIAGGNTAAAACYRIADIYRDTGNKGKEVEQLRLVLRRHPKTKQASDAHNRLESYGVKLIGGDSKAKED